MSRLHDSFLDFVLMVFLLGCCMILEIQAQDVFQKMFYADGNFYPRSINPTPDHGAVIGGLYSPQYFGYNLPFLLKLNPDWSIAWSNTYGEFSAENVASTKVCDDGTYVIAGCYGDNIYLIKVDQSGTILLSKMLEYSGDKVVRTISKIGDAGFIIGGRWYEDAFLMRVDQEFKPVWVNIFGGYDTDHVYGCQAISDSDIVAAGYTMSYGRGDADIFLVKFNMSGQLQWAEAIGSSAKEAISGENCLSITHDGSIIMTGYINDPPNGAGAAEVILVKVDKTGELKWAQTYGGNNNEYGFMVKETCGDSGFVINGYTTSYSGVSTDHDAFLIKTKNNGDMEWFKVYGTPNSEVTGFGYQDSANCFIFSGEGTNLFNQQKWIYLVRTDSSGYSGCPEKTIETVTGELTLMVTPIEGMSFTIPYYSDFPLNVMGVEVGDSAVCDTSADTTSIHKNMGLMPKTFNLEQNYPNPFNPSTTIEFTVPKTSQVTLKIYDIKGREVKTLLWDKRTNAGNYQVEWNGRDNQGNSVATGSYYYQLETEGFVRARKMIYIK